MAGSLSNIVVNGMPLPAALCGLIRSDAWRRPASVAALRELTGVSRPEDLAFLTVEGMKRETAIAMKLAADPRYAHGYGLRSSARDGAPVGARTTIDVDRCVVIAVNSDEEAVFLDYRDGQDEPAVVIGYWPADAATASHRILAKSFGEFATRIGLSATAR